MAVSAPASPRSTRSRESGITTKRLIPIGILALAFLYPLIDKALGIGQIGSMEGILIFAILAMGLNVVVGYAGLLDLGYAAFFAIGAYANAFLTSPASYFVRKDWVPEFMQNFWIALALSWVVAAIFGVLLGAPTLRLRGDYLAIVTLGFGEIVPNFFLNADKITGGTQGLNPIGKPTIDLPGRDAMVLGAVNQRGWYWLILIVLLFSLFIILRFKESRLGRSWVAIREDEIAAASMGVNLTRTKLWAFAMGASFAGFAGSVFASAFQIVNPDQFLFSVSVMVLAMVVLGGMGNVYGAILGALIIGGFDRILSKELNRPVQWIGENVGLSQLENHDLGRDRFIVFGLALVFTMLVRPEGLLPSQRRKRELHDTFENAGDVGVPVAGFESEAAK
jgi:branched-chain amino acid transport system permease protein